MPTEEVLEKGGTMEGFQLWVNLPAKDKMIPPRYQVSSRCRVIPRTAPAVWGLKPVPRNRDTHPP